MMKISVIILTKNCAQDLGFTLEKSTSELQQVHQVIFKDFGSTDDTKSIINACGLKCKRVLIERDTGISSGWNQALDLVTGDWVLFLNAGDYLEEGFFAKLPSIIEPSIHVVYGDVHIFNKKKGTIRSVKGCAPTQRRLKYGSIGFGHPGSLMRVSFLREQNLNFDTNLRIAMDFKLLAQIFLLQPESFLKAQSSVYMDSDGVSTKNLLVSITETFNVLKDLGIISSLRRFSSIYLLYVLRFGARFIRCTTVFRSVKHHLFFFLGIFEKILIIPILRVVYFKFLRFKIGRKSGIGHGFDFYQIGNINIGDNSIINRNCLFDNRAPIHIGTNCSIGHGVRIYTGGHNYRSDWFEFTSRSVHIGDNSVIYAGAMIMPGVNIGESVIVFPGSVVCKDVADYSVVAGNPAQVISKTHRNPSYRLHYPFPTAK